MVRDRGTSVYRCRASVRLIKKMGEFRNRFLGRTAAIRRVICGRQAEITTSHFCDRDTCAIAG